MSAIDTLQISKDLQAASFTPTQAEALARVLRDRQEADLSQLATKADLKAELLKWIITMLLGQVVVIAALVKLL